MVVSFIQEETVYEYVLKKTFLSPARKLQGDIIQVTVHL